MCYFITTTLSTSVDVRIVTVLYRRAVVALEGDREPATPPVIAA